MKKRFFAFGCSYTRSWGATWADFIGVNFDEYANFGRGGASNTFIMNRIVEFNENYGFNPETDYVIVMLTGFGRFSYLNNKENTSWQTNGDIYSNYSVTGDKVLEIFIENMWSDRWAVYQSWIAAKNIKNLLVRNNIKHDILMGINNTFFLEEMTADIERRNIIDAVSVKQACEIYDIVKYKESLDEWKNKRYKEKDHAFFQLENYRDMHPTTKMHYEYVLEKFPNFINEKTHTLLEKCNELCTYSSQSNHWHAFLPYQRTFDHTDHYRMLL